LQFSLKELESRPTWQRNRFHPIPVCDGQTDGRTDGRTDLV